MLRIKQYLYLINENEQMKKKLDILEKELEHYKQENVQLKKTIRYLKDLQNKK